MNVSELWSVMFMILTGVAGLALIAGLTTLMFSVINRYFKKERR